MALGNAGRAGSASGEDSPPTPENAKVTFWWQEKEDIRWEPGTVVRGPGRGECGVLLTKILATFVTGTKGKLP